MSENKVPEWVWLHWDWAQAELYALALFSKDETLRKNLTSGDVHRLTIADAMKMDLSQVTEDMREVSKVIIYAAPYSGFDIESTASNAVKKARAKNINLSLPDATSTLKSIISTYSTLYEWTGEALFDWFDSEGWVQYLYGQRKQIIFPAYLRRDESALRRSSDGRTALNTYGQNSIGILLKMCMSKIWKDPYLRQHTTQYIPVFDALSCLVRTSELAEVQRRIHQIITPVLTLNDFSIRMNADWKASKTSWGNLKKIPSPDISKSISPEYQTPWELKWTAGKLSSLPEPETFMTESTGINPFNPFAPQAS